MEALLREQRREEKTSTRRDLNPLPQEYLLPSEVSLEEASLDHEFV